MYYYLIVFLLIIGIIIYFLYTPPNIKYYDFGNPNSNIKICLIAGVHGNEPAGTVTLNNLINSNYFTDISNNIFIRVIPCVNEWGYNHGTRWCFDFLNPDINRCFSDSGNSISKNLLKLILGPKSNFDLIIDFHEGWGYHLINSESIGSTVSPNKNVINIGKDIVDNLNKNINEPEKKFTLLENTECDIDSALSCFLRDQNYILIETTGQNNIQPLEHRCKQVKNILDTIFKFRPEDGIDRSYASI